MPLNVAFFTALLALICLWISLIDIKTLKIPDLANACVAGLGVVAVYRVAPDILGVHLLSALIVLGVAWGGSEFAFRRFQRDVFGLGDVKLLAAGTIWVGPFAVPSVLLIAALSAILFAVLMRRRSRKIPFGPFLSFAILLIWVHGPIVI